MYPWPLGESDPVLDDALRIAMDYLTQTEQAEEYSRVQTMTALIILYVWRKGVRHPIRLANYAIVAIERKQATIDLGSIRPHERCDIKESYGDCGIVDLTGCVGP